MFFNRPQKRYFGRVVLNDLSVSSEKGKQEKENDSKTWKSRLSTRTFFCKFIEANFLFYFCQVNGRGISQVVKFETPTERERELSDLSRKRSRPGAFVGGCIQNLSALFFNVSFYNIVHQNQNKLFFVSNCVYFLPRIRFYSRPTPRGFPGHGISNDARTMRCIALWLGARTRTCLFGSIRSGLGLSPLAINMNCRTRLSLLAFFWHSVSQCILDGGLDVCLEILKSWSVWLCRWVIWLSRGGWGWFVRDLGCLQIAQ